MGGVFGAAVMVVAAAVAGQEFEVELAGADQLHPALSRFGPDAAGAVVYESEGLEMKLTGGRQNTGAVGISPRFRIGGDFQITVDYEVRSAGTPAKGLGAGVKLWGQIAAPEFQAMTLACLKRPKGVSRWVSIFAHGPAGKKRQMQMKMRPVKTMAGRLRVVREGDQLKFLAAEGSSEVFQELQSARVASGDVKALRIAATTHDDPCGVSVRLLGLSIEADRLPGKRPERRRGGGKWLLVVVSIFVLVVLGGGGFLLWRRAQ